MAEDSKDEAQTPVNVPPAGTSQYVDPNSGAAPQPGGYPGLPTIEQDTSGTDIGADTSSLDTMRQNQAAPAGSQPGDEDNDVDSPEKNEDDKEEDEAPARKSSKKS